MSTTDDDTNDYEAQRAEAARRAMAQLEAIRNRPRHSRFNLGPVLWWLARFIVVFSALGIVLIPGHWPALILINAIVGSFAMEAMPRWRVTVATRGTRSS